MVDIPPNSFGFVYKITNTESGKFYIGKKQLIYRRKKKLTKKELNELTDKRLSKFKYTEKESDWATYNGSCKELLSDIRDGKPIEKEILMFCPTKSQLTYFETKYQFCKEVIELESYNDNINGKYYRKIFDNE
jgi:hypothetical protein